jgi:hypothetical protein
MLTLTVGPDLHSYIVHEELLCEHAPFFQVAVKEEWKEGKDRTIPLPEDDPDVVSLYLHWIYASRILSRKPTNEGSNGEIRLLVDAFVFGEKIQDGRFKDAVIDAAIKSTTSPDKEGNTWFPGVTATNRAYKGTPPGSPLRRLIVDFWALNGQEHWDRKGLNADFLTDLTGELLARRQSLFDGSHPSNGKTSTCSYHQHGDDQSCYSRRSGT